MPKLKYRSDIDGLRAIAVTSVVFSHAFRGLIPGGFVGVDIFFVISGFLIGGMIGQAVSAGTFSYLQFYMRRALRILPALIFVLLSTIVVGWALLLPDEFSHLGKHVIAGAGFVANLVLWNEAGYFDAASLQKPLLHLWSLSVEEQFYILWPFLAVLAFRLKVPGVALAASIAALSFSYNIFEAWHNPVADFYSPLTRFWELMTGCIVAFIDPRAKDSLGRTQREALSAIGLVLLFIAFGLLNERDRFPGFLALIPVLGAALSICVNPGTYIGRALGSRPMAALGLVSYPLYLWHWPLLSMAHIAGLDSAKCKAALVAVALGLAVLTFQFIERPIRYGRISTLESRANHLRAILVGLAMLVTSVAGYWAMAATPRLGQLTYSFKVRDFGTETDFVHGFRAVDFALGGNEAPLTLFVKGDLSAKHKTLFIGDSTMIQYSQRVSLLVERGEQTRAALFSVGWGCPPVPGLKDLPVHKACDAYTERSLGFALQDPSVDIVVFGAQWFNYFWAEKGEHSPFYFEEPDGARLYVQPGTVAWSRIDQALRGAFRKLRMAGKTVFLVLNNPVGDFLDPHNNLVDRFSSTRTPQKHARDAAWFLDTYAPVRQLLVEAGTQEGARIIDPVASLCDRKSKLCQVTDQEGPIYADNTHLRVGFTRQHATWIDPTMSQ
jgi:peptidoglycan/LPS O-acetylase OafA/YrhL